MFFRNRLFSLGSFFLLYCVLSPDVSSPTHAEEERAPERLLYQRHCAICHGERGDGQGEAAALLQSKPRNFTKGEYKIKSTSSGMLPLDEDLFRSVKFGIPGTAMLPQDFLSDEEIRGLVAYIKRFSPRFAQAKPAKPISIPPAPTATPERIVKGRLVYEKSQCLQCHGPEGKGDGVLAQHLSVKPADFTRRPLKSGPLPIDIVRTILTGFEGTPMPPYEFMLEGEDVWNLVYYLDSLGRPPQQTDEERKGREITRKQQQKS